MRTTTTTPHSLFRLAPAFSSPPPPNPTHLLISPYQTRFRTRFLIRTHHASIFPNLPSPASCIGMKMSSNTSHSNPRNCPSMTPQLPKLQLPPPILIPNTPPIPTPRRSEILSCGDRVRRVPTKVFWRRWNSRASPI
ncbi:hypothetical protein ACFX14_039745 [Malus domestica]